VTDDEEQLENPMAPSVAELAHIAMPPALIDAAREDPDVIVQLARGQTMLVQDRMVRKLLENPEASIGQYVAVHERLTKTAKIDTAQPAQGGNGNQVVINIVRMAPGKEKVTIEGQAQRVEASE
jgi:hypothetical protein